MIDDVVDSDIIGIILGSGQIFRLSDVDLFAPVTPPNSEISAATRKLKQF